MQNVNNVIQHRGALKVEERFPQGVLTNGNVIK